MNLANKTIWITGASSGIGSAISVSLASESTNLILSGRNIEGLKETQQQCINAGALDTLLLPFEATNFDALPALVEQAEQWKSGIDILVNNAGVSQRSMILETQFNVYRTLMEIDYFAPVALSKLVLPGMIKRGGGTFAVTSSIVGLFGFKRRSGYAAAKHALHGFFDTVRSEHHKDNIRVLMILPGYIKTNISYSGLTGTGEPQNEMDYEQSKASGPTIAGKQVVKALKRNKETVIVGKGLSTITPTIRRFLPFVFKLIQRQ